MSGSTYKDVPEPLQGTWKLTDLEISFVSACPQGANPGAKVMLKKERILMPDKNETINVNVDIEALSKSMSENLKKALGDLLAKDKNLSAEAMTDAVIAVVAGDIAKVGKDIDEQLKKAIDGVQKEIDAKLEKARKDVKTEKAAPAGEETLTLNGTSFKKSEVGEHAFAAIKASAIQQESLRKEIEHGKAVARVEKEYPHVAGKPDDKASLLELIEKADEAVKTTGLAILKALNDAGEEFKKEKGAANADTGNTDVSKVASDVDATMKLDAMAKELAKKEGISVAAAYAKVLETPEGEALYNQHRGA